LVDGALPPSAAGGGVMFGIDVLAARNFDALAGKRVGLVTNHTSVDRRGVPTRVLLHRSPVLRLDRLFVPEHGLDGKERAGVHIAVRTDPMTGLTAHSLYGATRKPTPSMLKGLDVLVFDLQDIGCRSYTYVSTMALCMEACAEARIEFVVLDRPNPLGGIRMQGPPIEKKWQSFVGQMPTPYVHGMTAGELARMAHGERWVGKRPRLRVVPMAGWARWMVASDGRYPWVATSPNIPKSDSPFYYVATGILGGAVGVDAGIGTPYPFEYAGAKGVDGRQLASALSRYRLPGVSYTPYARGGFGGVKLQIDPRAGADIAYLAVVLVHELNRLTGGAVVGGMSGDKLKLFNKVYGGDALYRAARSGVSPDHIAAAWGGWNASFAARRAGYLLYQ
jgi:uncharacterized protein YbbC (DUF1343 family)